MNEYMTLKQMRDQVARQIGDTSADRATKIDEWLNNHYSEHARKYNWPQLLRSSEEVVSLTSAAAHLYLPKEVEALFFVMPKNQDAATNMALDSLIRDAGTQFQTSGVVYKWADAGEFGRRRDFHTAAEKITLTTSGTAAVAAVVQGTITSASPGVGAQELREEVSISPSTGVTTTNTFTDIYAVSCAAVAATSNALITVTGATSGNTYATIGEGEQTARYRRIRLMLPPTSGDPVTLIWKKRPFKLISDNQAVEIPVGPSLIEAATATMFVNQREYNAAAIYHAQRAKDTSEGAFNASQQQGEHIYLSRPMAGSGRRHNKIIVVNP